LDPETYGFDAKFREGLLQGPWIADLWLTDEFHEGGSNQIYRATNANFFPTEDERAVGHTVLITGFDSLGEEKYWESMNSHGTDFRDGGFGKASDQALNWLYRPRVLP